MACCPVCLEEYSSEEDSKPLVLPCGHTVCRRCIKQLSRLRRGTDVAEQRTYANYAPSPVNVSYARVGSYASSSPCISCPFCKKSQEVVINFLPVCYQLIPNTSSTPEKETVNSCDKHKLMHCVFCVDCEEFLCRNCVAFDQEQHKECNLKLVKKYSQELKKELEATFERKIKGFEDMRYKIGAERNTISQRWTQINSMTLELLSERNKLDDQRNKLDSTATSLETQINELRGFFDPKEDLDIPTISKISKKLQACNPETYVAVRYPKYETNSKSLNMYMTAHSFEMAKHSSPSHEFVSCFKDALDDVAVNTIASGGAICRTLPPPHGAKFAGFGN